MACLSFSFVAGGGRAARIRAQTRILGPLKKQTKSIEVDLFQIIIGTCIALSFRQVCKVLQFRSLHLPNFRSSSTQLGVGTCCQWARRLATACSASELEAHPGRTYKKSKHHPKTTVCGPADHIMLM